MAMDYNLNDGLKALEQMKKRASCRSFQDKEIPVELLDNIIDTGLAAASGGNLQPISVVVIKEKEKVNKTMELCGGQKFIAQAPVNLLFVLDWNKMGVYAKSEKAPYACYRSYKHFLIGLEDVVCLAQTIETAAHLCGLGSCYVGTVNQCGDELIKLFNLPEQTYPVLMLSVGYPKEELEIRKKLSRDIMVFEDRYPDLSEEEIISAYRDKYGDQAMKLPPKDPYRADSLERFKKALLTTYTEAEADEIVKKADELGYITETQRRFGLHYHAAEMLVTGVETMQKMYDNNLKSFKQE